jgi:O-antigen ligase
VLVNAPERMIRTVAWHRVSAAALKLVPASAAALLLASLLALIRVSAMHPAAAGALVGLAGISCWRPEAGLTVVAGVIPIASWLARGSASPGVLWVSAVIAAFLAGFLARRSLAPSPAAADAWPANAALVLGMVVAASLAVQLSVLLEQLGAAAFREHLTNLVTRADLLMLRRSVPALQAAALLLEGLALYYAATRIAQLSPRFPRRLMAAVAVGGVAAAAVNIERIARAALRSGSSLSELIHFINTQRINEHYVDMNAAGSYFVLALWIAVGLACARRRVAWVVASAAIAVALWMTGSRAALLAGCFALVVPVFSVTRVDRRRGWLVFAAVLLAIGIGAAAILWAMPMRGNQRDATAALMVRLELTRTAFNMLASRPIFGIGTGQFYARSGEFSSPELLALFPPARNENAHNNFLQILAELGIVGFVAFMWVLALAARRAIARLRSDGPALVGTAAGMTAFLITCLGGHPLLIPEVSASFWLALAILSTAERRYHPVTHPAGQLVTRRRLQRLAATIAAVLIATLPVRARQQIAGSNFEHVGIGLSRWHRTEDNLQYRTQSGRNASVFVPGDAGSVTIPVRAAARQSWDVELYLDGRPVNVVRALPDKWTNARVVLPKGQTDRKYRRVDLAVRGSLPENSDVLLVGKVIPQ